MSARNLEPCFVPTFLPSNMSDEEFINVLDNCLPRAIVARIEELSRDDLMADVQNALNSLGALEGAIPEDGRTPDDNFDKLTIEELRADYAQCTALIAKFDDVKKRAIEIREFLEGHE